MTQYEYYLLQSAQSLLGDKLDILTDAYSKGFHTSMNDALTELGAEIPAISIRDLVK